MTYFSVDVVVPPVGDLVLTDVHLFEVRRLPCDQAMLTHESASDRDQGKGAEVKVEGPWRSQGDRPIMARSEGRRS